MVDDAAIRRWEEVLTTIADVLPAGMVHGDDRRAYAAASDEVSGRGWGRRRSVWAGGVPVGSA